MGDPHAHAVFASQRGPRERILAEEEYYQQQDIAGISVVSLPQSRVDEWIQDMECFHSIETGHLMGRGVEGPGLRSPGGTPTDSAWLPTKEQFSRMLGARPCYVVCSAPSHEEVELFARYECNLCLGHLYNTPPDAVQYIETVRLARQLGVFVLVDHFLNDMNPWHLVYHERTAPRTDQILRSADRLRRAGIERSQEVLGPVPAALLRLAHEGQIAPMLNCDGRHVAYPIIRALFDLIGAGRFLAMTDHLADNGRLGSLRANLHDDVYWNGDEVAGSKYTLRGARLRMAQSGLFSAEELDVFFEWRQLPGCKEACDRRAAA
jgi:hypothetical protein